MIAAIFRRELFEYWNNRQFRLLSLVLVLLTAAASLEGWGRARDATSAREAAQHGDHENWTQQGKNNPHGAAHFSRYAFRPTPALAAFEPGVFDVSGAAIWMEAHNQNPATLRRAEDRLGRAPVSSISPAWVVRMLGSLALVILLFRSIAQERETKTLRAVVAAGMQARSFVMGKLGAAALACLLLSAAAILIAAIPGWVLLPEGPETSRVLALLGVSLLALLVFALMVIMISARSSSSGAAMVRGAALWLVWAIGVPVMAAQLATELYPDVDERAFKSEVQLQAQTKFWVGGAMKPEIAKLESKILETHGAKSLKELNFSPAGVKLQAHEEFANRVYDRLYGDLYAKHRAQDRVFSMAAWVSPLVALQRLSAGIAGTDLLAQQVFTGRAEAHRRKIIGMLNRDLMEHGGGKDMKYLADRSLWEKIPDFELSTPALSQVMGHYRSELLALLAWFVGALWIAVRSVTNAMKKELHS